MTGRDYRKMIKLHRDLNSNSTAKIDPNTNENYKFISKLIEKQNLVKYQQVDYDLFKNFIHERKVAANDSLNKVKKIEELNKTKKEQLFSKHHTIVWLKEYRRLESHIKHLETELEDYFKLLKFNSVEYFDLNEEEDSPEYRKNINYDEDLEYAKVSQSLNLIDELENYSRKLNRGRDAIKKNNDMLISDLKEDFEYYMSQNTPQTLKQNKKQNEQILSMIDSVKSQLSGLIKDFDQEYSNVRKKGVFFCLLNLYIK
jgi:hypothetical protein